MRFKHTRTLFLFCVGFITCNFLTPGCIAAKEASLGVPWFLLCSSSFGVTATVNRRLIYISLFWSVQGTAAFYLGYYFCWQNVVQPYCFCLLLLQRLMYFSQESATSSLARSSSSLKDLVSVSKVQGDYFDVGPLHAFSHLKDPMVSSK